ncbi:MAG: DnaJ domain-containing protein [Bacteroidota bacterium]|jgi:curved DNA-binding protein CbpA
MAFKNYYEILGIEPQSNIDQIREAYRKQSEKYKSETNINNEFSQTMLKDLNEAIEVLSNPDKRRAFDETFQVMEYNSSLLNVHSNLKREDVDRIADLTQKYFEHEKLVREKYEKLLAAQNAKSASYFTSLKVIMVAVVLLAATYYYKPEKFAFLKGKEPHEIKYYEWITIDSTLIYSKPKSNSKVIWGVPAGTGFNAIEESTYYIKVNFIDADSVSKTGYVDKGNLSQNHSLNLPTN